MTDTTPYDETPYDEPGPDEPGPHLHEHRIDLELDCRGLTCPRPVIELARHLSEVPVGGVVGVVATDQAARTDVPAWCRLRGHEFLGEDGAPDGARRYLVRRLS